MAASAEQTDGSPKSALARSNRRRTGTRFRDDPFGLRDLGYIEGKNIEIERRFADGPPERFPRSRPNSSG